jgi:preprotein translocase subunit SecD
MEMTRDSGLIENLLVFFQGVVLAIASLLSGGEQQPGFTITAMLRTEPAQIEAVSAAMAERVRKEGYQLNSLQILVEGRIVAKLSGRGDPSRISELLTASNRVELALVLETGSQTDPDARTIPGEDGEALTIAAKPLIANMSFANAEQSFDHMGAPAVAFRMTPETGKAFGEVSAAHIGRRLAILRDGKALTAPVIREPILGGSGIISGSLTVDSAQTLALGLMLVPYPAEVTLESLESTPR